MGEKKKEEKMSEDKRKHARTQGRFSGEDREFTSRRQDKQSSKMPSPADKNKGDKRKAPLLGSRVRNEIELQYEGDSKYSFQEFEPVRKPQELRFTGVKVLSETENGISRLIYDPDFMKLAEAQEYMTILQSSTVWHDKNIVIGGVEYPQPRLVAWYGPHPYTYAGATLEAKAMPAVVREIKEKIEASLRQYDIHVELNSVLLNLYRNEKDSVAWHSDDEFSLGVCPTIASVSLGETRKFEIRPKAHVKDKGVNDKSYVNLTDGSLIVMDGCMQKDWQHQVPKEFHDKGSRINLTFRTIYPIDQNPPEMCVPFLLNKKNDRPPVLKVVHQQEHQFDTENFPPLGMEAQDKKSKLPKEKGCKDYQQPVSRRKSQSEETWDDEMLQSVDGPKEALKIQNNFNKNSNYDPISNSSDLQPSQFDVNSNIKESSKSDEYHSDSSETSKSHNLESNDAYELESNDPNLSESKPVEVNARTANSGKKYMLNANAPEYVPQNKFEKCSLSELAEICKVSKNVRNEDLQSFSEVFFKCIRKNTSLFIDRDWYELECYYQLNDGSLSDKHLKIILERISSMITNAFYRKNEARYTRYSNDNYRKPRQSYSRSNRY